MTERAGDLSTRCNGGFIHQPKVLGTVEIVPNLYVDVTGHWPNRFHRLMTRWILGFRWHPKESGDE